MNIAGFRIDVKASSCNHDFYNSKDEVWLIHEEHAPGYINPDAYLLCKYDKVNSDMICYAYISRKDVEKTDLYYHGSTVIIGSNNNPRKLYINDKSRIITCTNPNLSLINN